MRGRPSRQASTLTIAFQPRSKTEKHGQRPGALSLGQGRRFAQGARGPISTTAEKGRFPVSVQLAQSRHRTSARMS